MSSRLSLLLVGLAAVLTTSPDRPPEARAAAADDVVRVVAEPKYYVSGPMDGEEMQLFQKPDPKRMWRVDGFVFEILRPAEYAGRIIGMHHDGVLASGDPYKLWEVGRQYEFGISQEDIGKLSFGPCSVDGTRKLLPKPARGGR